MGAAHGQATTRTLSRMTDDTSLRRVLITGADGVIGGVVRRGLADRYSLRLLTHHPAEFESIVGDVTSLESIEPAFEGVDSVVHLAGDPHVSASWESVCDANVVGSRNVFEAAARAGVRRVVYASSNHAIGMYEVDGAPAIYSPEDSREYDDRVEVRPDSPYGVSKVAAEALGRYYVEQHGLSVVALRIGAIRADDDPTTPIDLEAAPWKKLTEADRTARHLAVWLSHRDCVSLVAAAIEADVRWAIAYGVSDNPGRFWSLEPGRRHLGWSPADRAPA